MKITTHYNEKYKYVRYDNCEDWKYGYKIYCQIVKGKTFVTFKTKFDKLHFNDSHSISINEFYGKKETLLEMIKTAEKLGW